MDNIINYIRGTNELKEKTFRALKLLQDFNRANFDDLEKQENIIRQLFGNECRN